MKYGDITNNKEIQKYYEKGNAILAELGYTDHSVAHTTMVAKKAAEILTAFNYDKHDIELVKIAGFLHDIGNVINRSHHAEYGALLANEILKEEDLSIADRVQIVSAIANHDESTGVVSDPITAALIIADKTDVRRTRVRRKNPIHYDIHDRVNHAVTETKLECIPEEKLIVLHLTIDESSCTMYEYFDIFLSRMTMCSHAARFLGAEFSLRVNDRKVL
ncbi:MAG: HD domain-containing protein [Clostridia bacterium]|nr:HD domain-containing protein [Clostridia bacterium]